MGVCHSAQSSPGNQSSQLVNDVTSQSLAISGKSNSRKEEQALRTSKSQSSKAPITDEPTTQVNENPDLIAKHYRVDQKPFYSTMDTELRHATAIKGGREVSVKYFKFSKEDVIIRNKAIFELELLKKLEHPSLLRINEYFKTSLEFYFIVETILGKPLFDYFGTSLKDDNEVGIAKMLRQLLLVINYMHRRGIVHRRMRPWNIYYDGQHLKLVDISSAAWLDKGKQATVDVATDDEFYLPPESKTGNYSKKSDIYTIGVIFFRLLTRKEPYGKTSVADALRALDKKLSDPMRVSPMSESAIMLFKKMLDPNPKKRPSAIEALGDPWLQNEKAADLYEKMYMKFRHNFKVKLFKSTIQRCLYFLFNNYFMIDQHDPEIRDAFEIFDVNGDGTISLDEYINFLDALGLKLNESQVELLFKDLDLGNAGCLTYKKFQVAMINEKNFLNDKNLQSFFDILDEVR
jgi:calcium-dependent protein kinase